MQAQLHTWLLLSALQTALAVTAKSWKREISVCRQSIIQRRRCTAQLGPLRNTPTERIMCDSSASAEKYEFYWNSEPEAISKYTPLYLVRRCYSANANFQRTSISWLQYSKNTDQCTYIFIMPTHHWSTYLWAI